MYFKQSTNEFQISKNISDHLSMFLCQLVNNLFEEFRLNGRRDY